MAEMVAGVNPAIHGASNDFHRCHVQDTGRSAPIPNEQLLPARQELQRAGAGRFRNGKFEGLTAFNQVPG